MTPADHKILVAMSAGAVLRDVYRAGYKLARAPFSERTLTMPDGIVKQIGRPAIARLRAAGMIATPDDWSDVAGHSYDAKFLLTAAGLAASGHTGDDPPETYEPPVAVEAPVNPHCDF